MPCLRTSHDVKVSVKVDEGASPFVQWRESLLSRYSGGMCERPWSEVWAEATAAGTKPSTAEVLAHTDELVRRFVDEWGEPPDVRDLTEIERAGVREVFRPLGALVAAIEAEEQRDG